MSQTHIVKAQSPRASGWPAHTNAAVAREVFNHEGYRDDLRLMQAWISVPAATLVGLLDTIRNRVLSFVLELETVDIETKEQTPFEQSETVNTAQVTQIFHQTIYGPVSNAGTAGSISQTMIVGLTNLEALKARLREQGLPEPDLKELEKAIAADQSEPKPAEHHFGKNVAKWLGEAVKKAATDSIKVGADVIATVATKALKDYYGIG